MDLLETNLLEPDLLGMDVDQAIQRVTAAGRTYRLIETRPPGNRPPGDRLIAGSLRVIRQTEGEAGLVILTVCRIPDHCRS